MRSAAEQPRKDRGMRGCLVPGALRNPRHVAWPTYSFPERRHADFPPSARNQRCPTSPFWGRRQAADFDDALAAAARHTWLRHIDKLVMRRAQAQFLAVFQLYAVADPGPVLSEDVMTVALAEQVGDGGVGGHRVEGADDAQVGQ